MKINKILFFKRTDIINIKKSINEIIISVELNTDFDKIGFLKLFNGKPFFGKIIRDNKYWLYGKPFTFFFRTPRHIVELTEHDSQTTIVTIQAYQNLFEKISTSILYIFLLIFCLFFLINIKDNHIDKIMHSNNFLFIFIPIGISILIYVLSYLSFSYGNNGFKKKLIEIINKKHNYLKT